MVDKYIISKMKSFGFRHNGHLGSGDLYYGKEQFPFCTIFRLDKFNGCGFVEIKMEDPWNKDSEINIDKFIEILTALKEMGYTEVSGMS